MLNSNNQNNMMLRAISAMMSGQSPRQFLQSIPQLQGLDLNNLQQTAKEVCDKQGVDMAKLTDDIKSQLHI